MSFDFRYPTPLPSTKGWGPGWPYCQPEKIVPVQPFIGGFHEDIAELMKLLVGEMRRRGFDFMEPGCWGYGCRATKSSVGSVGGTPSFHSWGLAPDFNAPRNVFGSAESTSEIATKERWVVDLMREYGFFWLGPPIKDWMHFSFVGSRADAVDMTVKARRELGGDMTPEQERKLNTLWNMLEAAAAELGQGQDPKGTAAGTRIGKATRKVEEGIPPAEGLKRGDTVTLG